MFKKKTTNIKFFSFFIFSRLVRQENVKEDANRINQDQRSPVKRTFAEAKQTLPEYEQMTYNEMNMIYTADTFLEADEDEPYDTMIQYTVAKNYSSSDSKVRYDEEEIPKPKSAQTVVRSAESFLNDTLPEYCHPDESNRYSRKERPRRRRSRELTENEIHASSNDDEPKRKPEAMRSISEDTPTRQINKPVTRRALSHPEKDLQVSSLFLFELNQFLL